MKNYFLLVRIKEFGQTKCFARLEFDTLPELEYDVRHQINWTGQEYADGKVLIRKSKDLPANFTQRRFYGNKIFVGTNSQDAKTIDELEGEEKKLFQKFLAREKKDTKLILQQYHHHYEPITEAYFN